MLPLFYWPIRRQPSLFILAFAALWLAARVFPAQAQTLPPSHFDLTILHTNDLHGHLLPFDYTEFGRSGIEQPNRGGAAPRATLIRQLKAEIKNPVLVVDSGDTFTRGPLATTSEGIADIESMNTIGYDVACVGNNEFKAKDAVDQNDAAGAQAALLRLVKRSRFPWICANATDEKGAILQGVEPYIVRNIGGVRVGFIGLTAPRSASYPQVKGWTITDPIAAAKEWIQKARANCDILIAITHIGTDMDKQLAAQTSGLDAIIGGDSHTFLYTPVVIPNLDGINVPIVQDGEFGIDLGRFDLNFMRDSSENWHLANYHDALIIVDGKIKPAADVEATLEPYVAPFRAVVGHLAKVGADPIERSRLTSQVLTDAMRSETGADFAINPIGVGMFGAFHHKDLTKFDVYSAMPFHDDIITVSLTGAQLGKIIPTDNSATVSPSEFNPRTTETYKVAMVDFIASTVYKLPSSQLTETGIDERDIVIRYISKRR